MTYEEMFKTAKELLMTCDCSQIEGHLAYQIDVVGEGEGAFYIEINDGKMDVQPYEYYDRDCKLIAKADTFLKIFEGNMNPVAAFTMGKLKVEGDLGKALELQKIIGDNKKEAKVKVKTKKK